MATMPFKRFEKSDKGAADKGAAKSKKSPFPPAKGKAAGKPPMKKRGC
jgi:hypothetical protein